MFFTWLSNKNVDRKHHDKLLENGSAAHPAEPNPKETV
jgi:hypothetical protein